MKSNEISKKKILLSTGCIFGIIFFIFILILVYLFIFKKSWYIFLTSYMNNIGKSCNSIKATPKKVINDLYYIMKVFNEICNKNNIRYVIFSGTQLGAVRHQAIIPWDDDLDVVVWEKDKKKLMKVLNQFHKYDIKTTYTIDGVFKLFRKNGKKTLEGTKFPFMDIFFFKENNDYFVSDSKFFTTHFPKEAKIPLKYVLPRKKYKLGELEVYGLNNADKYLKKTYSSNYITQVRGHFMDHKTNKYTNKCSISLKKIMKKLKN